MIPDTLSGQEQNWILPEGCSVILRSELTGKQTEDGVPYEWFYNYGPILDDAGNECEAAGKLIAANGVNKVWECYVSGLDPMSVKDQFRSKISFDKNGGAKVEWTPDLNEGGTKHERVYTVEGKANLVDQSWGPTNEATRFFRVKVQMP